MIDYHRWFRRVSQIVSTSYYLVSADPCSHFSKCYKVQNLADEEATLIEPASCAIHGMDKVKMPFGANVLLIGAGPTGLILSQLMKVREAILARAVQLNKSDGRCGSYHHRGQQRLAYLRYSVPRLIDDLGLKMDVARQVEAADTYIDLDRKDAKAQWAKIKEDNPCTHSSSGTATADS